MRRLLITVAGLAVAFGASAPAFASSGSTDGCTFSRGVTVCEDVTRAAAPSTQSPGHTPNCVVTTTWIVETHTFTAHRGETNSDGTAVAAPDAWSFSVPTGSTEQCTTVAPSITSSFGKVRAPETYPNGSTNMGLVQGRVEFLIMARGLEPNADVDVSYDLTHADGSVDHLKPMTMKSFGDGSFGTGVQLACSNATTITAIVRQGDTVLTVSGDPADAPSCQ